VPSWTPLLTAAEAVAAVAAVAAGATDFMAGTAAVAMRSGLTSALQVQLLQHPWTQGSRLPQKEESGGRQR